MASRTRGSRWWVVVALSSLALLVGCGSEVSLSPSTSAASRSVDPPEDLNQLVKAGERFVTHNPAWFADHGQPEPISTTDRSTWKTLPKLPEAVSAVGFGVADNRLVVAATTCAAEGVDLCGEGGPSDLSEVRAPLRVWVLASDGASYDAADLPEGIEVAPDSLTGTTQGTSSIFDTSEGSLLVSADGRSRILKGLKLDLSTRIGYTVTGSRLLVVGFAGDPESVKAKAQLKYTPSSEADELSKIAARGFAVISVSYVSLDDPTAEPTVLQVPADAPDLYPLLTPTMALWVDDTHEYVLDLETAEFSTNVLPTDVAALASVVNPVGGRDGQASADGTVYLTPDPQYGFIPDGLGVARRTPDGQWAIVNSRPPTGGHVTIADGGLFAVVDGKSIEQVDS